jgi:hypothetical protein
MAEPFAAAAVEFDVVRGPVLAEQLTLGGEWGVNGWSESLRQELLPDVRVTIVEPGVVATEQGAPIAVRLAPCPPTGRRRRFEDDVRPTW